MSKSYLQQQIIEIKCKGSGETQHQAVEASFKAMREQLTKEFHWPIVSLSTVDYIIDELKTVERTEAFLFFFMKRTRVKIELDVTIKVQVDYVNIEGGKSDDV